MHVVGLIPWKQAGLLLSVDQRWGSLPAALPSRAEDGGGEESQSCSIRSSRPLLWLIPLCDTSLWPLCWCRVSPFLELQEFNSGCFCPHCLQVVRDPPRMQRRLFPVPRCGGPGEAEEQPRAPSTWPAVSFLASCCSVQSDNTFRLISICNPG